MCSPQGTSACRPQVAPCTAVTAAAFPLCLSPTDSIQSEPLATIAVPARSVVTALAVCSLPADRIHSATRSTAAVLTFPTPQCSNRTCLVLVAH